jgi:hypothetical protein
VSNGNSSEGYMEVYVVRRDRVVQNRGCRIPDIFLLYPSFSATLCTGISRLLSDPAGESSRSRSSIP